MHRYITATLAAVVCALGIVGAAAAAEKKPEIIRFAYQPSHALFIVANEQGWFKDEFAKDGTVFEAKNFLAGPPIIEAFAGGRLDFGLVGDQPALLARANNIDVKTVGVPLSGGRNLGLLLPAGSTVKNVGELKGKKVAVTVGSVGHHFLFLLLQQNGLKPSDIQVVNLLPPDIKQAIEQKNVDAAVTWDPFLTIIDSEGSGKTFIDAEGIKNNANTILVSGEFARTYPEAVDKILRVLLRAEHFIEKDPDEAARITAKATGYNLDVVKKVISHYSYDIRLTPEVLQAYEKTTAFLRDSGILRKDVAVSDLVDASFLTRIGAQ